MNKVFGFGAMIISVLLVLNVLFQVYKVFFVVSSPDAASGAVNVVSIVWLGAQLALAVLLWYASRVFIKMG